MFNELKTFGLTGYEIKVYEALLKQGSSSARELHSLSKVPITAIYPNIKSLEEKGLVKSFAGDIKKYEVINPKIALKQLAEKKSAELLNLHEKISPRLTNLKDKRIVKHPDPVELSAGAKASLDLSYSLVDKAEKSFYIVGWGFRKLKSLHRAVKLFQKLGQKNIDVRVIFGDDNERTRFLAKKCDEFGVQARFFPMNNCSLVMADSTDCKLTLKRRNLPEQVNIHIVDTDLVSAFNDYALLLWGKAHIFE